MFGGVVYAMGRLALEDSWTAPLLGLILFQIVVVGSSLPSSTRRRRWSLDVHKRAITSWREHGVYPSVDVFLPCAGEDIAVLRNSHHYASMIQWAGKLRVYVLDDAGRDDVRRSAHQYGFEYLSRPAPRLMKKAGNLKYAAEHSTGAFELVLDADFVPRADILNEMMPYMADPTVGIVQSPQFFDTREGTVNWLQAAAGATQELFYRWVQPARDVVDAAICVGTCAVYRTEALRAAGGFAQIGYSEDVHTGLAITYAGYTVRYVPLNLAKGLCPATFEGAVPMFYRWCIGSMTLLSSVRFHTARLGARRKLCYWTGFLYYISTAVSVFTVQIPGLIMLYAFPDRIQPRNYIPLAGTILAWALLMPAATRGRWTPAVVRIQVLIGFIDGSRLPTSSEPKIAAWVPTGAATKTSGATYRRTMRLIRIWIPLVQIALWSGIVVDIFSYGIGQLWATVLFAAAASYFLWPLVFAKTFLRYRSGSRPRRHVERVHVRHRA